MDEEIKVDGVDDVPEVPATPEVVPEAPIESEAVPEAVEPTV